MIISGSIIGGALMSTEVIKVAALGGSVLCAAGISQLMKLKLANCEYESAIRVKIIHSLFVVAVWMIGIGYLGIELEKLLNVISVMFWL